MNQNNPLVSVVIPCYNMGNTLIETIESVHKQTFQNYEIIVVDDGSTDRNTKEVIESLDKNNLKLIRTDNCGLPSARNTAIRASTGRYICPLDADDMLHPEYLEKTVNVLEADQEEIFGFVTTDYRFFEGQDRKGVPKDYDPILLAVENCIPVTSLFRKKCWEMIGGYEETLSGYQDWNLWIQIVAKGFQWKVIREELFFYRDRSGSMLKKSDQRRGQLASKIYDLNRSFYNSNSEEIIKAYAQRMGEVWEKYRSEKEKSSRKRNLFKYNVFKLFK